MPLPAYIPAEVQVSLDAGVDHMVYSDQTQPPCGDGVECQITDVLPMAALRLEGTWRLIDPVGVTVTSRAGWATTISGGPALVVGPASFWLGAATLNLDAVGLFPGALPVAAVGGIYRAAPFRFAVEAGAAGAKNLIPVNASSALGWYVAGRASLTPRVWRFVRIGPEVEVEHAGLHWSAGGVGSLSLLDVGGGLTVVVGDSTRRQ